LGISGLIGHICLLEGFFPLQAQGDGIYSAEIVIYKDILAYNTLTAYSHGSVHFKIPFLWTNGVQEVIIGAEDKESQ